MTDEDSKQKLLKQLPGVDRVLEEIRRSSPTVQAPKAVWLQAIRAELEHQRRAILTNDEPGGIQPSAGEDLIRRVTAKAASIQAFKLKRVINATGVVVHTNLGRSCLAPSAVAHVAEVADRYSNLEFDLARGRRGSRYSIVEDLLCEISGAEAAMVVNNNAGAVLLCLNTLARDRSVIISRGELVEIGGSFRIPDVMARSGAKLKEIGATNRTHLHDYENAIGDDTGLLLKVHASNFSIVGFTSAVSCKDLVVLGDKFNLPVMEDLGSGNFIDLSRYGLPAEPTVQDSVSSGVHVVTFSGDKLLGGPQAGLIVGRREIIARIQRNPLTRALRIDKFTLAALEATLSLYRDEAGAVAAIPTLAMLTAPKVEMERRAAGLRAALRALDDPRLGITLLDLPSRAGGGALPLLKLPSCCVGIRIDGMSANTVEEALRRQQPPVIGRIEDDTLVLDPRTLQPGEDALIAAAVKSLLAGVDQDNPRSEPRTAADQP